MQYIRIKSVQANKSSKKAARDARWYNRRYSGRKGAQGLPKHIISEYKRLNK